MTRPSSYQKPRNDLRVGERVRLASIPAQLLEDLSESDTAAVRAMVGKVLPVTGFNAQGEVELEFRGKDTIAHTIWVGREHVKKLVKPGAPR